MHYKSKTFFFSFSSRPKNHGTLAVCLRSLDTLRELCLQTCCREFHRGKTTGFININRYIILLNKLTFINLTVDCYPYVKTVIELPYNLTMLTENCVKCSQIKIGDNKLTQFINLTIKQLTP